MEAVALKIKYINACDMVEKKTYSVEDGEELSSGVKLPFVTVILTESCYGQELDKPKY
jgi:hypothetical protein